MGHFWTMKDGNRQPASKPESATVRSYSLSVLLLLMTLACVMFAMFQPVLKNVDINDEGIGSSWSMGTVFVVASSLVGAAACLGMVIGLLVFGRWYGLLSGLAIGLIVGITSVPLIFVTSQYAWLVFVTTVLGSTCMIGISLAHRFGRRSS